ncbi:amino acid adenylation domain-containing protein [Chitinophaga sp. Mgbs1]|uniref:Amino acid adenylation domain-containing protein n=1 Tax=Chitinophaga solisilvae TaxID=1233460 RepID=A0A3S1DTX8_9BACT|nr:amino acid adenylation domain-containing protein [Chitinophaga solisilvae]
MKALLQVIAACRTKGVSLGVDDTGTGLKLKGNIAALTTAEKDVLRTHKAAVISLLLQAKAVAEEDILPAAPQASWELSSAQRRIWLLSQLEEGNAAYNIPVVKIFEGVLRPDCLQLAFNRLLERHEILRAVFREDDNGEVRQHFLSVEEMAFAVQTYNLQEAGDDGIAAWAGGMVSQPFQLTQGPLLRACIGELSDTRHVFCLVMHHIISDGWSMDIIITELMLLYAAACHGSTADLPALPVQYRDYAAWQQRKISAPDFDAHRNYWTALFSGELPVLAFPADKPRPAVKTFNGGMVPLRIPAAVTTRLKTLLAATDSTLFTGLSAAVNLLLYRYTGQDDIITGTPVSGRSRTVLENQVGLYLNTLALRTRINGQEGFLQLLRHVRQLTLESFSHQDYPFDLLTEELQLQWDRSRNPLFDVMVILRNNAVSHTKAEQHLSGLTIREYEGRQETFNKFDLSFNFMETGDEIEMLVTYNGDIYTQPTATRAGHHLIQLLDAALTDPHKAVAELSYLTPAEYDQLLSAFNNMEAACPADKTIVDLFEEQARRTPEATAVVCREEVLSYAALDSRATLLAQYLRTQYHVGKDDLVGIMLHRSADMIVAILGILKAGAAYVPVDPEYPASRKAFILKDTQVKVLLTAADAFDDTTAFTGDTFLMDRLQTLPAATLPVVLPATRQESLAYVIYTSGSTGEPKGVMITHRSLMDYCEGIRAVTNIDTCRTFGLVSTIAADLGNTVLFPALITGGALHVYDNDALLTPEKIFTGKLDCIKIVPSHWMALQEENHCYLPARCLIFGGEQLTSNVVTFISRAHPDCEVYNHYGPSETTIGKLLKRVELREHAAHEPLGKPFCRSAFYILSEAGQLQPVGVAGEICISGDGLASGYLNRPELTAARFLPNPFVAGERIYKTGDVGRWLENGCIEFMGRTDDQVKIRGYRIEPGEIEAAIRRYAAVTAAAVVPFTGRTGEKQLAAYVAGTAQLEMQALQTWLATLLPAYMIPAYFIRIEAMPLTLNGKIDRKRLPAPEESNIVSTVEYIAPRTALEQQLAEIWRELLQKEQISVKDNFFLLGGHSLKATRLLSSIRRKFQVALPLKSLFSHMVLEEQALLIAGAAQETHQRIQASPVMEDYPLSPAQRRFWILSQFPDAAAAYHMPGIYQLHGTLNIAALQQAFRGLVQQHEILRTVFREDAGGNIRQVILPADVFSGITCEEVSETDMQPLMEAFVSQPFSLTDGPLLRAALYGTAPDSYVLVYVMHHIISDGWSMGLLFKELLLRYHSLQSGMEPALQPLPIQYKDYAWWQQEQLQQSAATSRQYWLQQLSGELPVTNLPADRLRPAVKTYRGDALNKRIPAALLQQLKTTVAAHDATLFMGLLAAVHTLLYRYTGQQDNITGSPVAGREHADLEGQLGLYLNTLALRVQTDGQGSYAELLQAVRRITLDAYAHQSFPFEELVNELRLPADLSRSPLFDVMVILQNTDSHRILAPEMMAGVSIRPWKGNTTVRSKFDLTFSFAEAGEELDLWLEYNTDIFDRSTIARIATHFTQLLKALLDAPQAKIGLVDYLSAAEKKILTHTFNDTYADYPAHTSILQLLARQAAATPDATAISCGEACLSYLELQECSNRFAAFLQQQYQLGSGDLAAVMLRRDEWLIVALLGVLKTGAAYVPLDPEYPEERIRYMMNDSRSRVLIDETVMAGYRTAAAAYPAADHATLPAPDDAAYVIYTSGSTGAPKGVVITHLNAYTFICWCLEEFAIAEADVVLGVTSVCFDLSIFEIFYTLACGKELRLLPNALSVPDYLDTADRLLLNTVPGVAAQLLAAGADLRAVKVLNMAGETLPAAVAHADGLRHMTIRNLYGPSEDTTYSTVFRIGEDDRVLIGRPIANTAVFIISAEGALQPVGVTGEICISGDGLAKEYLHRPDLTAEKFVPNPFLPGQRMYKTGDLGRWLPDGNLEFTGRKDDQVKIRGYRIEPGEIAAAIRKYTGITSAVVVARTGSQGEKFLTAYFVSHEAVAIPLLQAHLETFLPHYMVPGVYVQLETMPMTLNGKIDRKRLPAPASEEREAVAFIAPQTTMEKQLAEIWCALLETSHIGLKDNFFLLGGHSLKVIRLQSQVHKAFQVRLDIPALFRHATLEEQARLIAAATPLEFNAIPRLQEQEDYMLSSAQRRFWILSQFPEAGAAYHMPGIFELQGQPDIAALNNAFATLINRHEILRSVFREQESGEVRQVILAPDSIFSSIPVMENADEAMLAAAITAAVNRPFDLSAGPLLRTALYHNGKGKYILLYVMHHIISDGWSVGIMLKELITLYNSFRTGSRPELSPLKLQYRDYAAWQQSRLHEEDGADRSWWQQQLSGVLPVLEMPADRPRPALKSYNGGSTSMEISAAVLQSLKATGSKEGNTLFMQLLTAVYVLLHRYSGQDDIIIGSPVAGRNHADLEDQLGLFLNTLPLRMQLNPAGSFTELLQQVRRLTLDAFAHQQYPFEEMLDSLQLTPDLSRSPLFDVMIVLQQHDNSFMNDQLLAGDMSIRAYRGHQTTRSRFDLTFSFVEVNGLLQAHLEYNTDLWNAATAAGFMASLDRIITGMAAAPEQIIGKTALLSEAEKIQQLQQFNATAAPYPAAMNIPQLFELQAAATPEHIALSCNGTILSYAALNTLANRFAHFLQSAYGFGHNSVAAIQLDKGVHMMAAILGVLKCGGVYMPADPVFPQERVNYMMEDSGCSLLIGQELMNIFDGDIAAYDSHNPVHTATAQDLAYIMYTSGSTGKPKGVMVEHRSVVRLVKSQQYVSLQESDVLLSTGAVAFDATTYEYWGMLLNGGRLVLCPQETLSDTQQLGQLIRTEGVTMMWFTAGWFHQLIEYNIDIFSSLKTVLAGGDRLSSAHVGKLLQSYPALEIINGYGPTENTTFSLTCRITAGMQDIPVGRPVSNSTVYILDEHHALLPPGATGEICVGGDGLARGYVAAPELTAARFVPHPFMPGERIYKTGDLGRWLPDGNIGFLGRKDDQVKIRGYRIEPGEIENALTSFPQVDAALVMPITDAAGDKSLVAYLTGDAGISTAELRAYLSRMLPAFMLPDHYMLLERFPLTANGKTDKRALPLPAADAATGSSYVAPRNMTEEKLQGIWEEVLGRKNISVTDDFFLSGGHSLKANRLITRIYKVFGIKMTIRELFAHPKLAEQAQWIADTQGVGFNGIPRAAAEADYPLSAAQRRIWVLSRFSDANIAYNVPFACFLEGTLQEEALTAALNRLTEKHESLRTVFRENADGLIRQVVLPAEAAVLCPEYCDMRGNAAAAVSAAAAKAAEPFDLAKGPLQRVCLWQLEDHKWLLLYVTHHIVSDGWSMNVWTKELFEAYRQYDQPQSPAVLPLQYKDYAVWQQRQLEVATGAASRLYWLDRFSGEMPVLDFPSDKIRPAVKTYHGAVVNTVIPGEYATQLKTLCQAHGATLFMGITAIVNALLYRYTGQEDIILGTPVAGRLHADLEEQIGCYINTLALRTQFSGTESFASLLATVTKTTLAALEHQDYPFDELVNNLALRHDMGRNALFDVMITLNNTADAAAAPEVPHLRITPYHNETLLPGNKFDLTFSFVEDISGNLQTGIVYNTDLYSADMMTALAAHLEQLTRTAVASPDTAVALMEMLSSEEKNKVAFTFNDNHRDYPAGRSIVSMFQEQAAAAGEQPALLCGDNSMSYDTLNACANRMAAYLQENYQVGKGQMVGVNLPRNEWMIVAILGVLKAGAAYVPLDPSYPAERIAYILEDSQCTLVLDETGMLLFRETMMAYSNSNPLQLPDDNDLAYLIYTSGSTGKPKGVMIEHRNAYAFICWCLEEFDSNDFDIVFAVTSVCFDLSVFEIFYSLICGKKLRILDNALSIPAWLHTTERILLNTVPGVVAGLLSEHIDLSAVKLLNVAGEPVPPHFLQDAQLQRMQVRNLYGPSEDTTYSTMYRLDNARRVLIGKPISNTAVYILGAAGQLQPAGVSGEICISGSGLARGYLRQPALTAEKFTTHPFLPGVKMYRTGDVGYWTADGNIAFSGRKDNQVKIRGYRIEPGEIEEALLQLPVVTDALVMAKADGQGDKSLVAYIVCNELPEIPAIRTALRKTLPDYMIPAYFVQLTHFPLTTSGKKDRSRLPDHQSAQLHETYIPVAPRHDTDERLVRIWQELLGKERIGIRDNFFESGGHSLKLMQMISKIQQQFAVQLSIPQVFKDPYIEHISDQITFMLDQQKLKSSIDQLVQIDI